MELPGFTVWVERGQSSKIIFLCDATNILFSGRIKASNSTILCCMTGQVFLIIHCAKQMKL